FEFALDISRGRDGLSSTEGMVCGIHLGSLAATRQRDQFEEFKTLSVLVKLNEEETKNYLKTLCVLESEISFEAKAAAQVYIQKLRTNVVFNNSKPAPFEKAWLDFHKTYKEEAASKLPDASESNELVQAKLAKTLSELDAIGDETLEGYNENCKDIRL
ncbi:MAG: hypothetical protein AAF202_13115, partial [Pseudomonadota bacterium]